MATETIELVVHCYGCKKRIQRPSEAQMDVFRAGIPVHNTVECLEGAIARIKTNKGRI